MSIDHKRAKALYQELYMLLDDQTPLKTDCGLLCGHRCCQGDAHSGMRLFPGEEAFFDDADWCKLTPLDGGEYLLVCEGSCPRERRPLSCRIFPLFPFVKDHRLSVRIDPMAIAVCPLPDRGGVNGLSQQFVTAVNSVARRLVLIPECSAFLEAQTKARDPLGILTSEDVP